MKKFKLDPGYAVLYNRGVPHQVQTVTSGERIVAVNWCKSQIPNYEKRIEVRKLFYIRDQLKKRYPDIKNNNQLSIEEGLGDPWFLLSEYSQELMNRYTGTP